MKTFNAVMWAFCVHDFIVSIAPYIKAWIIK